MDQIFERVTAALATLRVGAADSEEQLHRQAAEAFANAGLEAAHEVSLAPRGVDLPKSIGGKPVTMMSLEKLWGIMLP